MSDITPTSTTPTAGLTSAQVVDPLGALADALGTEIDPMGFVRVSDGVADVVIDEVEEGTFRVCLYANGNNGSGPDDCTEIPSTTSVADVVATVRTMLAADVITDPDAVAIPTNGVSTLVITATVENDDLAQFIADDPDLTACVRARFDEVFGDNGAVLSTVDVSAVTVADDDAVTVTMSAAARAFLADLLEVHDDPDTFAEMGLTDAADAARLAFGLNK